MTSIINPNKCSGKRRWYEAAEKNGKGNDLKQELNTLFESKNTSGRKDATVIPATFLRVTAAIN